MENSTPRPSGISEIPKWAVVLIVVLALLFVMQSVVILTHFTQKPQGPRKIEATTDYPATRQTIAQAPALYRQSPRRTAQYPMQRQPAAYPDMWRDPFFEDAFSSIGRLSRHMSSLFEQMGGSDLMNASFMPAVDMEETKDAYIVRSDVPGLDKDKIDVTVRGNMLTIQGVREMGRETADERSGYYSQERSYGSFARSIMLPGPVDDVNIKADYKNGVLTVTLPKAQPDKETSKIPVQ